MKINIDQDSKRDNDNDEGDEGMVEEHARNGNSNDPSQNLLL
jgi:hypothetical protein